MGRPAIPRWVTSTITSVAPQDSTGHVLAGPLNGPCDGFVITAEDTRTPVDRLRACSRGTLRACALMLPSFCVVVVREERAGNGFVVEGWCEGDKKNSLAQKKKKKNFCPKKKKKKKKKKS